MPSISGYPVQYVQQHNTFCSVIWHGGMASGNFAKGFSDQKAGLVKSHLQMLREITP